MLAASVFSEPMIAKFTGTALKTKPEFQVFLLMLEFILELTRRGLVSLLTIIALMTIRLLVAEVLRQAMVLSCTGMMLLVILALKTTMYLTIKSRIQDRMPSSC